MEAPTEEQSQTSANDAVNIDILQMADDTPSEIQYPAGQIHKVPPLLRLDNNYQQDYDPLVVSLGPYHHGKEELQSAENFKEMALQMFVADSRYDQSYFHCWVLKHVHYARNCYIEHYENYSDSEFADMMLRDACFIINIILQCRGSLVNCQITHYYLGDFVSAIIFRDMIVLENQIPFWILKHLMRKKYGKHLAENMLNEFLTQTAFGECKEIEIASGSDKELPLHLVEAYRQLLVAESSNSQGEPNTPQGAHISNLPCFPWRKEEDNGNSIKKYVHCFRSATDLKAKGIHFRPRTTDSLMGINFKSGYLYAQLEVPIWLVTAHTKSFFLNLIAYELCPSASTNREIAAYIEFMKSLIDNPKDVKELREKRILVTTLGSDEEVVKVYKDINTYGASNLEIFHDVKEEIQAHYDNKAKTWLAELIYTYFRSPWTALALFAASFLLVFSFLQTYYTVRPS